MLDRQPSSNCPRVYTDVLTLLHQAMLLKLPEETVLDFWAAHPSPGEDGSSGLLSTLARLGGPRKLLPASYVLGVVADAEVLLCRHGLAFDALMQFAMDHLRHGHMVPMRLLTRCFGAAVATLAGGGDVRRGLLRAGQLTVRLNSPNSVLSIFASEEASDWFLDRMVLCPDASFTHALPPWDLQGAVGTVMRNNPRLLGCPPLEEVHSVCHMRPLALAVEFHDVPPPPPEDAVHATLSEFLIGKGIRWPLRPEVPDRPVQVATETLRCRSCGTVVIEAGSAYGAPCQIMEVRYRRHPQDLPRALANLARLAAEPPPGLQEANRRHHALVARVRRARRASFRFEPSTDRLYCNEQIATRGAAARMLEWMIREHLRSGTTDFERHRLIAAGGLDPLNPSFELRMRRLVGALETKCPGVRLARVGRGRWRLESRCSLEMIRTG